MRFGSVLLSVMIPLLVSAQWEIPSRVELNGTDPSDRQVRGLSDPTQEDAAISVDAVRSGTTVTANVTGTDLLVGTLAPPLASYSTGMVITIIPASANAPAAELEFNGLGARPMIKRGQLPLDSGDLQVGIPSRLVYDGTRFLLLSNAYRPCPSGYSAASATTCIMDSVHALANFHGAVMTCDTLGARLCTFGEWTSTCRARPGFLGTVSAYEWVADGANSAADGKLVGTGSNGPEEIPGVACEYGYTNGIQAVRRFRCCKSR